LILMPPSRALLSGCHSCCSWGLSSLMSGKPGFTSLTCCCCGCTAVALQYTSGAAAALLHFQGNTALSPTLPMCATSPTCLWLTAPLFVYAETARSSMALTRPQPSVTVPADASPEQHSEGSAALKVSVCVCVHTVWEQKLPKLAVLPAKLMVATLRYVMNRETGHGRAQTKLVAGRPILISTGKRWQLTSEMAALYSAGLASNTRSIAQGRLSTSCTAHS